MPVNKPSPTIAKLPKTSVSKEAIPGKSIKVKTIRDLENLTLEELTHISDGVPREMIWANYDLNYLRHLKQVILNSPRREAHIRGLCLLGLLMWTAQGYFSREEIKSLFQHVIDSENAQPKELAYAYFAYAYLELHRNDHLPDFQKVKLYFGRVPENVAFPVHRSLAQFYLTCLQVREQSYGLAGWGFVGLKIDPHLPIPEQAFAKLMLGEIRLFGLGTFKKAPSSARSLFLSVVESAAEPRVKAKAFYWLGLIENANTYGILTTAEAWLKNACLSVHLFRESAVQPSFLERKRALEALFKLGNRHVTANSDDTYGPHYESYLGLHLNENKISCIIS